MVKFIPNILHIIGNEYKSKLITSSEPNYGEIEIVSGDGTKTKIQFVRNITNIKIGKLDSELATKAYKIQYLIMNRNTFGLFMSSVETDDYMNDPAFYHSYKKIPIAISEFTSTGTVELVE